MAESTDGLKLYADEYGPPDAFRTVLCLPGLSRNARDFTDLATALAAGRGDIGPMRVIAMDLRGRGRSSWGDPETYTVVHEFTDVMSALDQWGIDSVNVVGTSRGGLITMIWAMQAPEMISRAVLNDIGPYIEPEGLKRISGTVGKQMTFPSFEALAQTLRGNLSAQFPRMEEDDWHRFARQVASENAEGVTFDYDPAIADGVAYDDVSEPTPDFWPGFDALCGSPVLVLRGALSDLLSAATVEAMRRRHPRLHSHIVPDEGHAPLLWDRPTIEAIRTFIAGPSTVS